MQAEIVLEKYLRVLHFGRQAVGRESEPLSLTCASETSKPTGAIFIQTTTVLVHLYLPCTFCGSKIKSDIILKI